MKSPQTMFAVSFFVTLLGPNEWLVAMSVYVSLNLGADGIPNLYCK
jgi:hypothetical protein